MVTGGGRMLCENGRNDEDPSYHEYRLIVHDQKPLTTYFIQTVSYNLITQRFMTQTPKQMPLLHECGPGRRREAFTIHHS